MTPLRGNLLDTITRCWRAHNKSHIAKRTGSPINPRFRGDRAGNDGRRFGGSFWTPFSS